MKRKTFVTIQRGSLAGSVGELLKNKKVFINNCKAFPFEEDEYTLSTFEELFTVFIRGKKLISIKGGLQEFENGMKLSFYHDRENLCVEILDKDNNCIFDSIID